ncbi:hypothetical protein GCM10028787_06130 [Brachybacterium horti]
MERHPRDVDRCCEPPNMCENIYAYPRRRMPPRPDQRRFGSPRDSLESPRDRLEMPRTFRFELPRRGLHLKVLASASRPVERRKFVVTFVLDAESGTLEIDRLPEELSWSDSMNAAFRYVPSISSPTIVSGEPLEVVAFDAPSEVRSLSIAIAPYPRGADNDLSIFTDLVLETNLGGRTTIIPSLEATSR